MHRRPLALRAVLAAVATVALAVGLFALAPVGAAFAGTQTLIAEQSTVTNPVAGQEVTIQVSTGAVDGSFPAGELTIMVEGTAMSIGGPANTSTGETQFTIGSFPVGPIIVDATLTPSSSAYSPTSTRLQVVIVGASDSISPAFVSAPALGKPVTVSTILVIAAGDTHAPGGVVGFDVGGVSVGSCTPAATGLARNWSCSATLPAPTTAGPYTVTATFGRSSYYMTATGSATATIAAAPVAATKPKAAAPATTSNAAVSTPTPAATPTAQPTSAATAAPLAADAKTTPTRAVKSTPANPWPWLFLAAVVLLIAAVVGLIVLLRRRQGTPEVG